MSFYIKEVIAIGKNSTSSIVFGKGLNIVRGNSETGKTKIIKCIDFIFGSKKKPFDQTDGYTTVQMIVATDNGDIIFTRVQGKNIVKVNSQNSNIANGDYSTKDNIAGISSVWLCLMGISGVPEVIAHQTDYRRMNLTFRSFLHTFFITEDDIDQEPSIILPKTATEFNKTYFLSVLLYLLSEQDFSGFTEKDAKKIREARKRAVEKYINEEIGKLSDRKKDLEIKISKYDPKSIETAMQKTLDELTIIDERIEQEFGRSKSTLSSIIEKQDSLDEYKLLLSRYASLRSQYEADIRRLGFIADGEAKIESIPHPEKCPYCDGEMPEVIVSSYTETANAELSRIVGLLSELAETEQSVNGECAQLESEIKTLIAERAEIDALIKNSLQPKAKKLKDALYSYQAYKRLQNEIEFTADYAKQRASELTAMLAEKDEEGTKYLPLEYYPADFANSITDILFEMLKICNYDGLIAAIFDVKTFDTIVNGKAKQNSGQGYRAYLNTILALVFRKYLCENGKFKPLVFVADSPLQSLYEGVPDDTPESMKLGMFQYLIDTQSLGQTIIIENTPPTLDYEKHGVVVHEFTKGKKPGRYGFLENVT